MLTKIDIHYGTRLMHIIVKINCSIKKKRICNKLGAYGKNYHLWQEDI